MEKYSFDELVIASHNMGKVQEITELLKIYSLKVSSASEYNLSSPEETGSTFEENALLKAHYVTQKTGKTVLADDSGLSVHALNGQPGIYSARWAGEKQNFSIAIDKIKSLLDQNNITDFSASFYCALALIIPEKNIEKVFLGEVKGTLTFPPRGDKGFGYDPIFIPLGYNKTFSELDAMVKNDISHRADAFSQLKQFLVQFFPQ